jgi:hypothetical protein
LVAPVKEKTLGASVSEPCLANFRKDYITPIKSSVKLVKLQKEENYEIMEPKIPPIVIVEGDILGAVSSLKFANHDLLDKKKFLDLAPWKYMKTLICSKTSFIKVEPQP